MKIWLDDLRDPPDATWVWVTNFQQFERELSIAKKTCRPIEIISFDHDLGEEKDGYDCIKLCSSVDFCEVYPLNVEVHSANPVGRDNILAYDLWYRRMRTEAFAAMEEK